MPGQPGRARRPGDRPTPSSIRGEFDGRLDAAPEMASRFEKEYPVSLAEAISAAVDQAGMSLG